MRNQQLLLSAPIVFKKLRGKTVWFIVKQNQDSKWEIPKAAARKTESTARTAIRTMGEQGAMEVKVLEEAGRSGGVVKINNKVVPQRCLYYLVVQISGSEVIGYTDCAWLEYGKAVRKLANKRDKLMLRQAKEVLKKLERQKPRPF